MKQKASFGIELVSALMAHTPIKATLVIVPGKFRQAVLTMPFHHHQYNTDYQGGNT